jgi:hypothetical protein
MQRMSRDDAVHFLRCSRPRVRVSGSALSASIIERVSQCMGAFAGLRAEDGSEAEAADQKGYMTTFS